MEPFLHFQGKLNCNIDFFMYVLVLIFRFPLKESWITNLHQKIKNSKIKGLFFEADLLPQQTGKGDWKLAYFY